MQWPVSLHDIKLTPKQLHEVLLKNQHCFKLVQTAKGARFAEGIFSFTGGFFAGYFIGGAVFQSETYPIAGIIGGGGIIVGIIFHSSYKKNIREAVKVYNETAPEVFGYQRTPYWEIGTGENGIGVVLYF